MSKKKTTGETLHRPTPIEVRYSCLWIKVDGETSNQPDRVEPDLEELQTFVGGYIERVKIDADQFAIVNENGRREGLDKNEKASEIAGQFLLGNVVIIRPLSN